MTMRMICRLVVMALACAIVTGCDDDSSDGRRADDSPPVLSVSPIDLTGPYNAVENRYGDVTFAHRDAIIPFGGALGPGRLSMSYEYYTIPAAPVRACCDSVVTWMFQNEGLLDYEIYTRRSEGATWAIQYDHVLNPTVSEGDRLTAGQVMGESGEWSSTIRRFELAVIDPTGLAICPSDFGTTDFNAQHDAILAAMNAQGFGPYASLCLTNVVVP